MRMARKIEVFQAVVVSTLLYGLATCWLNTKEGRQLDGFQARCSRGICRIPHSFISHFSNATVLSRSGQKTISTQLRHQQLLLLGRIARAPDDDLRRRLTFCPGSLRPVTDRYVREVGRPRAEWAPKLLQIATKVWGTQSKVSELMMDRVIWKSAVSRHF